MSVLVGQAEYKVWPPVRHPANDRVVTYTVVAHTSGQVYWQVVSTHPTRDAAEVALAAIAAGGTPVEATGERVVEPLEDAAPAGRIQLDPENAEHPLSRAEVEPATAPEPVQPVAPVKPKRERKAKVKPPEPVRTGPVVQAALF